MKRPTYYCQGTIVCRRRGARRASSWNLGLVSDVTSYLMSRFLAVLPLNLNMKHMYIRHVSIGRCQLCRPCQLWSNMRRYRFLMGNEGLRGREYITAGIRSPHVTMFHMLHTIFPTSIRFSRWRTTWRFSLHWPLPFRPLRCLSYSHCICTPANPLLPGAVLQVRSRPTPEYSGRWLWTQTVDPGPSLCPQIPTSLMASRNWTAIQMWWP